MRVSLFFPCLLLLSLSGALLVEAAYPTNFNNHSGCLYTHLAADPGSYRVVVQDMADGIRSAPLGKLNFDSSTACMKEAEPGKLVLDFETSDDWFSSMTVELQLNSVPRQANWEITKAILRIAPRNSAQFPSTTIELRSASGDLYARQDQSFSCSSLVLINLSPAGPQFRITLKRFQVQPFHEPALTVFAGSRDCSTWLTMPQIMGFLLVLFMIFTVLIGVYLLLDLGGHSGDLRFSKQGGMLMNQAQLDATKAD